MNGKAMAVGIAAAVLWSVVFVQAMHSMAGVGVGVCFGVAFGIIASIGTRPKRDEDAGDRKE